MSQSAVRALSESMAEKAREERGLAIRLGMLAAEGKTDTIEAKRVRERLAFAQRTLRDYRAWLAELRASAS